MSHKGLVCPKCGQRNSTKFSYISNIEVCREVLGFTDDGRLRVDGAYSDYGDDTKDRLRCDECRHEFFLISEVYDKIQWE